VGEGAVFNEFLQVRAIHAVFDGTGEAGAHLGLIAIADSLDEEIPKGPSLKLKLAEHVKDLPTQRLARLLELFKQSAVNIAFTSLFRD
jgi:hypothetical protein